MDQKVSPSFSLGSGPYGFELSVKRYVRNGLGVEVDFSGYYDPFPPSKGTYCQNSGCIIGLTSQATSKTRHEVASQAYEAAGLQILELAQLEIGSVHWTIFDPGSSAGQRDMKAGGVYSARSAIIGSTRAARCAGRSDASSVTATSTPATTA